VRGITKRAWSTWVETGLAPRLPEPEMWQLVPQGAILGPTGWFARGLSLSSGAGPWFKANVFVVPLFRPTEDVYFNHAIELLDPEGRPGLDLPTADNGASIAAHLARVFQIDGEPFLARVGYLEGFVERCLGTQEDAAQRGASRVPYAEEVGYAMLLLDDPDAADRQLRNAAASLPVDAPPWDVARYERARHMLQLLHENKTLAISQLEWWADNSARALGIERSNTS
jgi:hypothetical protein